MFDDDDDDEPWCDDAASEEEEMPSSPGSTQGARASEHATAAVTLPDQLPAMPWGIAKRPRSASARVPPSAATVARLSSLVSAEPEMVDLVEFEEEQRAVGSVIHVPGSWWVLSAAVRPTAKRSARVSASCAKRRCCCFGFVSGGAP